MNTTDLVVIDRYVNVSLFWYNSEEDALSYSNTHTYQSDAASNHPYPALLSTRLIAKEYCMVNS